MVKKSAKTTAKTKPKVEAKTKPKVKAKTKPKVKAKTKPKVKAKTQTPKSTKLKSKKARKEAFRDTGIVIVDDDIKIDQEKVNEERRAYLEEARSQEVSD